MRGHPGASSRAGLRPGFQHQGLLVLLGSPSGDSQGGSWAAGTYRLSLGASISFVAGSTRFTLCWGREDEWRVGGA